MKPASTLLTLLTVAAAGVDVASAQFITSTTTAPALAARNSNSATLEGRQDRETVHETITRTVRNSGSRTSTKPTASSSRNDDDDDDDDDKSTTRKGGTQPSSSSTTAASDLDESTNTSLTATDTPSISASPSEPPTSGSSRSGGGLSAGAAAGIAAGAVAVLAIIAAIAFLVWRRRQGGIRGAVVTADYPAGMASSSDPRLPPPSPDEQRTGAAIFDKSDPFYPGMDDDGDGDDSSGGGSSHYMIPPAGTMPGDARYDQYQQQQWASDTRHVSALTAYPSPGQPILPVSPLTPYYPNPYPDQPQQQQRRVSSYYGNGDEAVMASPGMGSPEMPMPAFLIPGGNKSRAMSFSSVSQVGGGPRTAEFVGSRQGVPSIMVVVEGGSPSPMRGEPR